MAFKISEDFLGHRCRDGRHTVISILAGFESQWVSLGADSPKRGPRACVNSRKFKFKRLRQMGATAHEKSPDQ